MTVGHQTSSRKMDHLRICCEEVVEAGDTLLGDVHLVHSALPECDMDSIDIRCRFLGRMLGSPLFIAAMTGGHPETIEVNRRLGSAAERYGLAMGVGSQRAALEDPRLEDTFSVVREAAPHAFLIANLGVVQLRDHGIEWAERAVEMIDAQAIAIHLNFLQEAIQHEGDRNATGCLTAIRELVRDFHLPVIVKETGCGISYGVARELVGAGVAAIDIGGSGGTSWAAVERYRTDSPDLINLSDRFADWGIPTAVSLLEVSRTGIPIIATGGLRNGIDIARCIALGATAGGMALPFLSSAMKGQETLDRFVEQIHRELRTAMFLTGCPTIARLRDAPVYLTGRLREYMRNNQEL
ncbi:MAG: type 2 isopentenyl-diphosphate Delta-isomerase [Methanoculleaceae archaeon]